MLHTTTFETFKALAKTHPRIVVAQEIYGDLLTPIGVFQIIAKDAPEAVLLDSSEHTTAADACIYIGLNPVAAFSATGQSICVKTPQGETHETRDPIQALRDFFHRYKCASTHPLSKFAGGMIGYLSYDAVRLFEKIPDRHAAEKEISDIYFTFYGTNIVFDKRSGKVLVTHVVDVQSDLENQYHAARQKITELIEKMLSNAQGQVAMPSRASEQNVEVTTDLSDAEYGEIVKSAQGYIAKGDAFQIVPSRRFSRPYYGDDFNVYRALRVLNPSPYQFYLRYPNYTLVGSSPERLVSLQQGIVESMPIAGTRRRGKDFDEDVQLSHALLQDEKELAEHMMLVDLARNDVGAVSVPGSVSVVDFKKIQKYSRVMHIVSRVQGQLAEGLDVFDVMRSVFPAGTLTGAPKIRAMEIIDALEQSRRGFYGGAICAIDNEGQLDSCITIRTACIKDGVATVRAGAGVVLDSVPETEADETRQKAQAVLDALALATGGFV